MHGVNVRAKTWTDSYTLLIMALENQLKGSLYIILFHILPKVSDSILKREEGDFRLW